MNPTGEEELASSGRSVRRAIPHCFTSDTLRIVVGVDDVRIGE
jgi:hypothetical protein